jgi:single-strand DNA-binding protein
VAVNETWFDKATEQKKERTTFVDCTAFGRTAEVISEYLGKGKPIFLVGKLQTDSWEDKTTGQKRSKLKVVIDKIEFLGAGKGGETRGEGRQSHSGEENQDTTEPSIKQIDESESPF